MSDRRVGINVTASVVLAMVTTARVKHWQMDGLKHAETPASLSPSGSDLCLSSAAQVRSHRCSSRTYFSHYIDLWPENSTEY